MRKSLIWLLWLFFVGAALAVQVTFTYIPPSGLVVRSVVLRGSMNG